MENRYFFAKKFTWCLVPLCKMMGQNLKKMVKWETKHTLIWILATLDREGQCQKSLLGKSRVRT
jgi:hypothetical protein